MPNYIILENEVYLFLEINIQKDFTGKINHEIDVIHRFNDEKEYIVFKNEIDTFRKRLDF